MLVQVCNGELTSAAIYHRWISILNVSLSRPEWLTNRLRDALDDQGDAAIGIVNGSYYRVELAASDSATSCVLNIHFLADARRMFREFRFTSGTNPSLSAIDRKLRTELDNWRRTLWIGRGKGPPAPKYMWFYRQWIQPAADAVREAETRKIERVLNLKPLRV